MIFEALYASAQKGELTLIDGGYCRWHLRKDGQLTILEIIATKQGAGSVLLQWLVWHARHKHAKRILAKCPADLEANAWYAKKGFSLLRQETTRSGRAIHVWVLDPPWSTAPTATPPSQKPVLIPVGSMGPACPLPSTSPSTSLTRTGRIPIDVLT